MTLLDPTRDEQCPRLYGKRSTLVDMLKYLRDSREQQIRAHALEKSDTLSKVLDECKCHMISKTSQVESELDEISRMLKEKRSELEDVDNKIRENEKLLAELRQSRHAMFVRMRGLLQKKGAGGGTLSATIKDSRDVTNVALSHGQL